MAAMTAMPSQPLRQYQPLHHSPSIQTSQAIPNYYMGNSPTSNTTTTIAPSAYTAFGGLKTVSPSPYSTIQSPTTLTHGTGLDRGVSEIGDRRRVKSVILNEELLGAPPQESVRYVEVPYVEEIVRHVPRREIVEVEKRVPKYEYEWTEKVVEVPQIQYVDKTVEVPQVHEVVRHVPRREVVEVPREIIRHVPKIETKVVEKRIEVPGQVIEVPKPYTVENKVMVPHHIDKEVPMLVAQTVRPVLTESDEFVEVDVVQYEPEMIPVDIHVPRGVKTEVVSMGVIEEHHRVVQVPHAQYNSMLRLLNPHINEQESSLPFIQGPNGMVNFLSENVPNIQPAHGVDIEGWIPRKASQHPSHYPSKRHSDVYSVPHGMSYDSPSGSMRSSVTPTEATRSQFSRRDRGIDSPSTYSNRRQKNPRPSTTKRQKGICPC